MAHWEPVLTELVTTRGSALARYATMLCGNPADGDDLVQEALTKVFTSLRRQPRDEAVEHAEAYVRRTIFTLYLDRQRRRKRWGAVRHLFVRAEGGDGTGTPPVPVDSAGERVDVQRALQTLPDRQRACVVLRFYADLTVPQIADELYLSAGSVKRYLHEAKTRLASALAVEGEQS
ncbi:sigma-70 family RNA polymerase sigma factor [Ruania alba]|uniref:RNA polymerase sigma-70 factor, ECF subfamily n=1 Tax=Ruania alba TaxID=648782 RepID=A0A1H5MPD9_9MICO|nr:sigma-70 family RNA polymerase sigma factor [Ruania alba]SEE91166.1 RNA polymerase sigma-70 factor, ECF subfamily [Ruania alba]